jgi:hypothetical protein
VRQSSGAFGRNALPLAQNKNVLAICVQKSFCKTTVVPLWLARMASITLKDIPLELHAQLKNEAAANFRSLTQEAMFRLERSFQIDGALTSKRDQKWIDEAIASGPESPLTRKEMDAIRDRILRDRK